MNFVLSNNLFAENGILERIHLIIDEDGLILYASLMKVSPLVNTMLRINQIYIKI